MKGVANIISAIFVVVVILTAAYSITTAYIRYSAEITESAKKAIERKMYADKVAYTVAECNPEYNIIKFQYDGEIPEYSVRVICYDLDNPKSSWRVMPYVGDGVLSAQYVSNNLYYRNIELNLEINPHFINACRTKRIKCVVIGTYAAKKIIVK